MQYIYHDYSGKFECYNPMTGEIFPIEKEQAVGLERQPYGMLTTLLIGFTITIMELHASG